MNRRNLFTALAGTAGAAVMAPLHRLLRRSGVASPPPFDPRQFYPIKIEQAPDNPFLMGIDCKVSCGGAPVPMVAGIEAEAINGRLGQVAAHLWLDDLDVWVEAEPVGGGGPVERAHLVTRHGFVVSLAREDGTEIVASRDGLKFRLDADGIATVQYRPAEERLWPLTFPPAAPTGCRSRWS